jgi:hypothetical protein
VSDEEGFTQAQPKTLYVANPFDVSAPVFMKSLRRVQEIAEKVGYKVEADPDPAGF